MSGYQTRLSAPPVAEHIITVAPISASSMVAYGPAKTREKSATTMPSSTPGDIELVGILMVTIVVLVATIRKIDAVTTSISCDPGNDQQHCCPCPAGWLP